MGSPTGLEAASLRLTGRRRSVAGDDWPYLTGAIWISWCRLGARLGLDGSPDHFGTGANERPRNSPRSGAAVRAQQRPGCFDSTTITSMDQPADRWIPGMAPRCLTRIRSHSDARGAVRLARLLDSHCASNPRLLPPMAAQRERHHAERHDDAERHHHRDDPLGRPAPACSRPSRTSRCWPASERAEARVAEMLPRGARGLLRLAGTHTGACEPGRLAAVGPPVEEPQGWLRLPLFVSAGRE